MREIKFAGRGGQGAVLASQILAAAFSEDGWFVQAFPSFGAERRGAPVSSFLRIDSEEITLRCGVLSPDWLVVFDSSLLGNPMILAGVTENTSLVVNGTAAPDASGLPGFKSLYTVDATAIAEGLRLKTTSFSIVNTAMVGAFAGASGLLSLESVASAVGGMVPVKKEENMAAAREAYEKVKEVFK